MADNPALSANLRRLSQELSEFADKSPPCDSRRAANQALAGEVASKMLLCNARGNTGFRSAITEQMILSRAEQLRRNPALKRPSDDISDEAVLGTQDCVFLFCGPPRYANPFLLVFKPEVEMEIRAEEPVASPFDSGGLRTKMRPMDTDAQRREFLERHELPVPEYREFLASTLATLFDSPWNYLDGIPPDPLGPLDLTDGDARRWTFEVRFRTQLALDLHLSAVLVPVNFATAQAKVLASDGTDKVARQIVGWAKAGCLETYVEGDGSGGTDAMLLKGVEVISARLGRRP
ncbi:MAG: hypothetical protein HZA54_20490 [Planctomycetes bacterium]|nr:hypothetical protein [Planctomycetota bacterium]